MAPEGTTLGVDASNLISSLFALLPIPVAVIDANGSVVLANSTFNDFFPNRTNVNQMPHHAVRVDGSIFDFDKIPLSDHGLYIFLGRDTTREEGLREQLVNVEKIGAMGRLVSGVANELNDPLAGIVGYAQLLARSELAPSTSRMVSALQKQAQHAGSIVQNFLDLATHTPQEKKNFDLNAVVGDVLSLRAHDHKAHDIVVTPELEHGLPHVFGSRCQIEQVVLNLVADAECAVGWPPVGMVRLKCGQQCSTSACDWKSQTTETVFAKVIRIVCLIPSSRPKATPGAVEALDWV